METHVEIIDLAVLRCNHFREKFDLENMGIAVGIFFLGDTELDDTLGGNFTHPWDIRRCKKTLDIGGLENNK